jgi:hypothetical protein
MAGRVAADVAHAAPAPEARRPGRPRWNRRWRPAVVLAGVVLVGAWLWLLYGLSWRVMYNSDHANAVLAGRDLLGNPLLRGWVLPGDPYWLTSLPVFGLVAALLGTGPRTMHAAPVLLDAGVVAAAWWLAGPGGRRPGRWVGTALVALLVGLPHQVLAQFLFTTLHVGTALVCLAAAALLARDPRRPAWWAGVLLLAAAVVSDPFAVTMGVLPVVCAGAAAALRQRRWTPVAVAAGAALLAGGAAMAVRLGLRAVGGFGLAPALPLAPASSRFDNLRAIPKVLGALLGVGHSGKLSGLAALTHAVGAALLVAGVVVAGVRLAAAAARGPGRTPEPGPAPRPDGWLDDVLFAGVLGGLATFVVATLPPRDLGSARYLITTLLYGALLAGRQLAWLTDRLASRGRAVVGVAVLALAAAYLATPLGTLDRPRPADPARDLVAWLAAHDLRAGYGPYWTASIITIQSGGRIPVRPVAGVAGRLRGYLFYSTRRWYPGRPRPGRWFLVHDPALPAWGADEPTIRGTFGPPSTTVQYGGYRILIWDHDLSRQLGPVWRDPERAFACSPEGGRAVGRLRA